MAPYECGTSTASYYTGSFISDFTAWINYEQSAAESWWVKHFQWKSAALHELWKEPHFELILRRPIWSRFIPRWSFRRWRAKT